MASTRDRRAEAGAALDGGDAPEALLLVGEAITVSDPDPDLFLLQARVLLRLDRLDEAKRAAQACLRLRLHHRPALDLVREINQRLAGAGSAAAAAGGWVAGGSLGGDYVIERALGRGGMGEVWLVRQQSSGQRFAVKTLPAGELGDPRSQQAFYRELQTWIDLPLHPHLVPCRFFRSFGDRLAIFAEFVDGASLDQWIGRQRLSSLEAILDVAIQTAWSLEVAHQAGVIHQDVKPANVLLTADRHARLTDFGLARARPAAAGRGLAASLLVSHAGFTPAYCSPEQSLGQPLNRKTDVWSWGLMVLQMFVGKPPCSFGAQGRSALAHFRACPPGELFVPLPRPMAELLDGCLQSNPDDRWASMAEVSAQLDHAHFALLGYHNQRPFRLARAQSSSSEALDRRVGGFEWEAPEQWRRRVAEAEGKSEEAESAKFAGRSRKAQAVADLAQYDLLQRRLERLVASGHAGAGELLAGLCTDKAMVHLAAGDPAGRVLCHSRALDALLRLVEHELRDDLSARLASAYHARGLALSALEDHRAAIEPYDRAIALWQKLIKEGGQDELAGRLASAYQDKARSLVVLGDNRAALDLCNEALEIQLRLVEILGRTELAHDLVTTQFTKAHALNALGSTDAALVLYDKVLELRLRLVETEGRTELANDLAAAYFCKALALHILGDSQDAVALYDEALALRMRLVETEGRTELAHDLARTYLNKALALGGGRDEIELFDRALAILLRLIEREGRGELAPDLAKVYASKAAALGADGFKHEALDLYDKALAIWSRLVDHEGRRELAPQLASTWTKKASLVSRFSHSQVAARSDDMEALDLYDKALAVWSRLVDHEGRRELLTELVVTQIFRAKVLARREQIPEAREQSRQAVALLQAEMDASGRPALRRVLEWARVELAILMRA